MAARSAAPPARRRNRRNPRKAGNALEPVKMPPVNTGPLWMEVSIAPRSDLMEGSSSGEMFRDDASIVINRLKCIKQLESLFSRVTLKLAVD
jgi:hypothetical protein